MLDKVETLWQYRKVRDIYTNSEERKRDQMASFKKWSTFEDKIIKTHYMEGIHTLKQLLPERTESAIRSKLCKLNLHLPSSNYVTECVYMVWTR